MNPAVTLTSIKVEFFGPQTPQLFEAVFEEGPWKVRFDHVAIGTGQSRYQAATSAAANIYSLNLTRTVREAINNYMESVIPPQGTIIEAEEPMQMYCVIGVNVERT